MNSAPTLSPSDRLSVIVRFLTADVFGRSSVLPYALVTAICMRLTDIARRFAVLALRVQEGKVGPPRPRAVSPAQTGAARSPRAAPVSELARLPRAFAWLLPLVPGSVNYGTQLVHLLADPEVSALVSSSPGFGRMLRPMCRMLGVWPLPDILKPPAPVRRAKLPEPAMPAGQATPATEQFPPMRPIYPRNTVARGVETWTRRSRGGFSSA